MHEQNKTKGRVAIALFLCFCVMALTSFLAVKSSLNKISGSETAVTDNRTSVTEQTEPVSETPVVDSQNNSTPEAEGNSNLPESDTSDDKYIRPVDGAILLSYAMDHLVYSKTLDQYMTHPGTDICAEMSTEVKAIADGTVSKVYNDDRYGVSVCITHEDGLTSVYSNLSQYGLSEAGDNVTKGQVIGCVGDTALFESLDESHLHFEIKKDGNCVDPGEFISSLKQ